MLLHNQLDHIAIGASDLDAGVELVKVKLGIDIPTGGEHMLMGTHNRLMGFGNDTYMEVIAINSNADKPTRPRWFGLDSEEQQAALAVSPKPIAWIMRTNNIEETLSRAHDADIDLGKPLEMTRGSLRWTIAVRDDGLLPEGGTLPVIIQWPDGPHPAISMQNFGFRLNSIRLSHPKPKELMSKLQALCADHLVTVESNPVNTTRIECELVNDKGKLFHF